MKIKMIGHSTVLIQTEEQKIITDPYFSERGNLVYKRIRKPCGKREDFLDVNLVLLSHEHSDHTDKKYFFMLSKNVQVMMPSSLYKYKEILNIRNGRGLKNFESVKVEDAVITAVPAKHPALCCGFIIQSGGKTIYYTGDTFYNKFMQKIGENYDIDVVLMPVTSFRIAATMNQKSAVFAAAALHPKIIIPVHLGIQPRNPLMRTKETVEGFISDLNNKKINVQVVNLSEGEEYDL